MIRQLTIKDETIVKLRFEMKIGEDKYKEEKTISEHRNNVINQLRDEIRLNSVLVSYFCYCFYLYIIMSVSCDLVKITYNHTIDHRITIGLHLL